MMNAPDYSLAQATDSALFADLRVEVPGYRLDGILDRGGQASVYKGIRMADGASVAIKVIHGLLADADARLRFEREVIALKALRHPNIVAHLESGQTSAGHTFLVMNFIDGMRLDEYLWGQRPRRSQDLRDLLQLFLKICRAVGAVHRAGITHRDLSPSNIRVDAGGEPHILDFGLARTAFDAFFSGGRREVTATHQFVGKMHYASPEQVGGGAPIDIRSDVYSLGVLLYQILADGRFPYDVGGSMAEMLDNILKKIPPMPAVALAEDGRDVLCQKAAEVALHALQKRPGDRPGSASELARELEQCLAGTPPHVKRKRKQLWMAAGFGVASVVILVALGKGTLGNQGSRAQVPVQALPARFTNTMGMNFVRIEPAEFTMGSALPVQKAGQMAPHHVKITAPFLVQTTLVTRGQFETFVNATGYVTDAELRGGLGSNDGDDPPHDPGLSWKNPGIAQQPSHPVVGISWNDAQRFINWMHVRDGQSYRLPTDAEWELACRGGHDGNPYFWGKNLNDGVNYANVNWSFLPPTRTVPVASFLPNDFGLYDMAGNTFQWCWDAMGATAEDAVDPVGPEFLDPKAMHVVRGTGYSTGIALCRVDTRYGMAANQANYASGFRLAIGKPIASSYSVPDPPRTSPPVAPDGQWGNREFLFNGKDFTGFQMLPVGRNGWSVQDQSMVGHGGTPDLQGNNSGAELRTTRLFQNFHLKFNTMLPAGKKGAAVRFVSSASSQGQTDALFSIALNGNDGDDLPGSIWVNDVLKVPAKSVELPRWEGVPIQVDIIHQGESINVFMNGNWVSSYSNPALKEITGRLGFIVDEETTTRFQAVSIRQFVPVPR